MKKTIFIWILFISGMHAVTAQNSSPHALGLRVGDNDGFGTEVNYQRALGDTNRLELGLGWRDAANFNAYRLAGIYQWVWNLKGNLNWYAGVGAAIGSFDFDSNSGYEDDSSLFANAAGNIGIEYDFNFPLILSLDFRPEIGLVNDVDDSFEFDLALGIRYQF